MIGPRAFILFVLSRVANAGCFSIVTPYGWNTGQNVTLYWSAGQNDAAQFCVKLFNPRLLRELLTIAVTLTTEQDFFTFVMPPVMQGDGYILSFVDIYNDNNVYASSAPFSIGSDAPSNGMVGTPPTPGVLLPPGVTPPSDQFGDTITIYSTVTDPTTTITLTSTMTPTPRPSPTLLSGNPRTLKNPRFWWINLFFVCLLCNIVPALI